MEATLTSIHCGTGRGVPCDSFQTGFATLLGEGLCGGKLLAMDGSKGLGPGIRVFRGWHQSSARPPLGLRAAYWAYPCGPRDRSSL